jgi:hypothetical protein
MHQPARPLRSRLSYVAALLALAATAQAQPVPAPVISGNIPLVIPAHDPSLSPTDSRPYFDVFSWQSFIALNWPASAKPGVPNQPNTPAVFTSAPNGTSVVWMTYKTSDDLFATGSSAPLPWSAGPTYGTSTSGVPTTGTTYAPPIFARLTKASTPAQLSDTQEAFSFPLVDQNSAYVRYDVRYNQAFYQFVANNQLYLLTNLVKLEMKGPVSMPASVAPSTSGAMMIKAAWRVMGPNDMTGRYYVINAVVSDPVTGATSTQKMGLVGLHIAQKLKDFPEWIWSTFEQVDNVQCGVGSTAATPISFNNGTATPATPTGWANRPASQAPVSNPSPVQVTRLNAIPTTPAANNTQQLNASYQQALKGTVWQFYELVVTQWPSDPTSFKIISDGGTYPAGSGQPFPLNGCTNTTMETYFQSAKDAAGAGGNSCMQCHYSAAQADFSWGLKNRAH